MGINGGKFCEYFAHRAFVLGIGGGFGVTPSVTLAYLIVAGFLFAIAKQPAFAVMPAKAVPAE